MGLRPWKPPWQRELDSLRSKLDAMSEAPNEPRPPTRPEQAQGPKGDKQK